FIENGTLGLIPEKYYFVYRNVRISDIILYALIVYSLIYYKEYKTLFKSKSLLIAKLFLLYLILEFFISFIRYGFNPIEYFFRLKGLWQSFLIFPFLLLFKRNGFTFLIKLIFPVAVISNILYILSALTGIPFLGGVSIIKQQLPGNLEVYRVYGGTFFGEMFYLGFVYYWITKKIKIWQIFLVVLFIIPHILAFGRGAWIGFVFTIFLMIVLHSLRKRQFRVLFRQAIVLIIMSGAVIFSFIQFIPESDYYIDALKARLIQGQDDVKYNEGTYGSRIIVQNNALFKVWSENDLFLGIGMHPMWVVKPESREEQIYYSAFCDVGWPAVLAAYGLIGLLLAVFLQFYYIFTVFKLIRKIPEGNLSAFFLIAFLSQLLVATLISFSISFVSTILWGFFLIYYYIAIVAYSYEKNKEKELETLNSKN
ncbi:MAG TPA: hypothetical protein VGK25_01520, partial [Ignavibacteria bacterium]